MNTDTASPHKPGAVRTLSAALIGAFRHWRWLVLVWIASLLPALVMSRPIAHLIDTAIGPHPGAVRIVRENDLALLIDALMNHAHTGGDLIAAILPGIGVALMSGVLLAPWISGMLVASLRERRALHFGELWLGGWREYGRQFRLLLVVLIPWALAGGIAMLAFAWAEHGADTRILEHASRQREWIAMFTSAIAFLLVYATVESARAAFAADEGLRSAFRACLRGLRVLCKRPLASLLIVAGTVIAGLAVAAFLQAVSLRFNSNGIVLIAAQATVLTLAWLRFARTSALAEISLRPEGTRFPAEKLNTSQML